MKKIVILVLSMMMVFLVACNKDDGPYAINDDISKSVEKEASKAMETIITAIEDGDMDTFLNNTVPATRETNAAYYHAFSTNPELSESYLNESNYLNVSKYYIKNIEKDLENLDYSTPGFEFKIKNPGPMNGERYIYVAETAYKNFDHVITYVFAKEDGKWLLENFFLGELRAYGNDVNDLIAKSKSLEDDGNYISAWMFIEQASTLISASPYLEFTEEDTINDSMLRINDALSSEITFPIDIQVSDDTYVKIYAIVTKKRDENFYCEVIYKSNVPENQVGHFIILNEATLLHEAAKEVLTGLGEGFDGRITYTAYFEEIEELGKDYPHMSVDLEE